MSNFRRSFKSKRTDEKYIIEFDIDEDSLHLQVAQKCRSNKSGKASFMHGSIKAKLIKVPQ